MCERWLHSFQAFYDDMGPRPDTSFSLDRTNVDGHYEPANCAWRTAAEQVANRRKIGALSHFTTEEIEIELHHRGYAVLRR